MKPPYANRKAKASGFTAIVSASFRRRRHVCAAMLSQLEILDMLKERPPSELAKVIDVAPPRITEMYKGTRRLKLDEAKKLVEHYRLTEQPTGLDEPVARLAVRWVAESLGQSLQSDDPHLEEIAKDLQELSEFAARPEVRKELSRVIGFLEGLKTIRQRPAASA